MSTGSQQGLASRTLTVYICPWTKGWVLSQHSDYIVIGSVRIPIGLVWVVLILGRLAGTRETNIALDSLCSRHSIAMSALSEARRPFLKSWRVHCPPYCLMMVEHVIIPRFLAEIYSSLGSLQKFTMEDTDPFIHQWQISLL